MANAPISSSIVIRESGRSAQPTSAIEIPNSWTSGSTPAPSWTVLPSISGANTIPSVLSVNVGTIANGSVLAGGYQWLRNGSPISGATSATYTTVSADGGTAISIRLTATGNGGTAQITTSAINIPVPATAPTITSVATFSSNENTVFSTTATANQTVTWTKSGTDAAIVTLNATTGAWSVPAQNFYTKPSVQFSLTATNSSSLSATQNIVLTITNVVQVPAAPTLVITPSNTSNSIQITDGASVSTITSRTLYWGLTNTTITNVINVTTNPYIHSDLTSGTTYYYQATITNEDGASAKSAIVTGITTVPSYTAKAAAYVETFPDADNTQLLSLPSPRTFEKISNGGYAAAHASNAAVIGGKTAIRTSPAPSGGDYTTAGSATQSGEALIAAPYIPASDNWWVEFSLTPGVSNRFYAGAVDQANGFALSLMGAGAIQPWVYNGTGADRTTLAGLLGNATGRFSGSSNHSMQRPYLETDKFLLRRFGNTLTLSRNGAFLTNFTGLDVSSLTGKRFGFGTYDAGYRGIDNLRSGVTENKILITELPKIAYPRKQGLGGFTDGAADINISGTYEGTVSKLVWRLVDAEMGTPIGQWRDFLSAPTIAANAWSGTIRVPCGLNGVKPYRIEVAAANGMVVDEESRYQTRKNVSICYTILVVGQSNAAQLHSTNINSDNTITNHPGGFSYIGQTPPGTATSVPLITSGWVTTNAESSNEDNNTGSLTLPLSTALNLPIYCINIAIGASGAVRTGPFGSERTWMDTQFAAAGGAFDSIYLSQGENEFAATSEASAWQSRWVANLTEFRTWSGQPAGTVIPIFYAITGRYNAARPDDDAIANAAATILRPLQFGLKDAISDCYLAHHYIGVEMIDAFHYVVLGPTGIVRNGNRIAQSMIKVLKNTGNSAYGPMATTATRSGATITVAVNLNGATSLTGSALTSWQVANTADTDFATPLTISSATVTGNQVILTLASAPAGAVRIRNYAGYNPDVSSWVIGNYADGSTIPMGPVVVPIVSN